MKVFYDGDQPQFFPSPQVTLMPGENDIDDALAAAFIANGTVRPVAKQPQPKQPRAAKGPEE